MLRYKINTQKNLIRTVMSDNITLTDYFSHIKELRDDPRWHPKLNSLFVIKTSCYGDSSFNSPEFSSFLSGIEAKRPGIKWAVVLEDPLQESVFAFQMRDFEAKYAHMRTFRNENEALLWLLP